MGTLLFYYYAIKEFINEISYKFKKQCNSDNSVFILLDNFTKIINFTNQLLN